MDRRKFCAVSLAAAVTLKNSHLFALDAPSSSNGEGAGVGVTRYVCEFIVNTKFEGVPDDVMPLGKKSILDGFGLALVGSTSELAPILREYLKKVGVSSGSASVIGTNLKSSPRFAAFVNGTCIHADDYDDTELIPDDDIHATVPVLPPAFALCESERRSGKDLLVAYQIGAEVEGKVTAAMSPRHYADGFHSTGTLGSFGSAAACAKLLRLDELKTAYALGIAAAEAGGIRDNFGTMTKPFQAGHAAENGVVAADLASLGWTAAPDSLEAKTGYFQAAGGGFDARQLMGRLGKPWVFQSPGVLIKEFPCGTIQQPVMSEVLRLAREKNIKATDVEAVEVGGAPISVNTLIRHHPTTGLEGKFSMEFCVAIILLDQKAGLSQFTDAVVQRADVQALIQRVRYFPDPAFDNTNTSSVKIQMKDGQVFTARADFPKGSPENPMSYTEVAEKFRANAELAKWPSKKTETVIQLVQSLETLPDVTPLTAALTV